MLEMRWHYRVGFAFLVLGLCLGLAETGLADKDDPKGKGKGKDGKSQLVTVDLNKLPPDVAKQVLKALEPDKKEADKGKGKGKGKGGAKSISLVEAITIAEKITKAQATKADRKDKDGVIEFKIDLLTKDGAKTKVTLDAKGQSLKDPKDDPKGKPDPKGKGKAK